MLTMLRRFIRSRGGNFATMTAIAFPVVLLGAGLTIDTGALYVQRREIQATTDLAALTAASHLSNARIAASTVMSDNGYRGLQLVSTTTTTQTGAGTLRVQPGNYSADSTKPVANRFVAGGTPTNAVQVAVRAPGQPFFNQSFFGSTVLGVDAIATINPEASFSVGSRLASVNDGLLNGLLGGLLGTNLSLSAVDYNALLGTKIDALKFLDQLAGKVSATAGTYNQLLSANAKVGDLLSAAADVPGVSINAKTALTKLARSVPSSAGSVALSKLLGLGLSGNDNVGGHVGQPLNMGLLDLVNASAEISNGKRFVSVPLGVNLLPLGGVTLDLAIGEPPQNSPRLATGPIGTIVRTAQTRLKLTVEIGSINTGTALLPKMTLIKLPIYLELASAQAQLTALSCSGNDKSTIKATIAATPGVAELYIAEVATNQFTNFSTKPTPQPAKLVDLGLGLNLLTINAYAAAPIKNASAIPLNFNATEIANQTIKTANTTNFTQSLTTELLGSFKPTVNLLGLNLGLDLSILKLVAAATPAIDTLLNTILSTLGVKLGQVDVWMTDANCGKPVLVQ